MKLHFIMIYQVIPYQEKHQRGVVDLILPIQQQEFNVPITIQDQPDLQNILSFYVKGNGNFWVAVSQEQVVGTIALVDIGNDQVALRKMFVHQQHRGKQNGVAQMLFDTLSNWCKQRKVTEVFLGTIDSMLAAHRFYTKNGFEELTKMQLPENFPIMRVDNKFFRLKIK
jgi:N-acetylglutamate synthase-like GNAT family acetyltransferase